MVKILIATVGKDPKDHFRVLGEDYLRRARAPFVSQSITVAEGKRFKKSNLDSVEDEEGELLLKVTEGFWRIALDEKGKQFFSVQFAKQLEQLVLRQKPVAFLIGGASGHSPKLLSKCDELWSLSSMTFPHRMAFCILSEQIYRAGEILRSGPYHK